MSQPVGYSPAAYPPTSYSDDELDEAQATGRRVHSGTERTDRAIEFPNPLTVYVSPFGGTIEIVQQSARSVYVETLTILSSSGIALAVHYFVAQNYPSLAASSDPSIQGSYDVAKFVGLTCLFKLALTPFHESLEKRVLTKKERIQLGVVSYLNPILLTLLVLRGSNVKPWAGILYTMGTFGLMKIIGKGYEYITNRPDRRNEQALLAADFDDDET